MMFKKVVKNLHKKLQWKNCFEKVSADNYLYIEKYNRKKVYVFDKVVCNSMSYNFAEGTNTRSWVIAKINFLSHFYGIKHLIVSISKKSI